jgi:hypothetical protein
MMLLALCNANCDGWHCPHCYGINANDANQKIGLKACKSSLHKEAYYG